MNALIPFLSIQKMLLLYNVNVAAIKNKPNQPLSNIATNATSIYKKYNLSHTLLYSFSHKIPVAFNLTEFLISSFFMLLPELELVFLCCCYGQWPM